MSFANCLMLSPSCQGNSFSACLRLRLACHHDFCSATYLLQIRKSYLLSWGVLVLTTAFRDDLGKIFLVPSRYQFANAIPTSKGRLVPHFPRAKAAPLLSWPGFGRTWFLVLRLAENSKSSAAPAVTPLREDCKNDTVVYIAGVPGSPARALSKLPECTPDLLFKLYQRCNRRRTAPRLRLQTGETATLPGDRKHAAASGLLYTLFDYPDY
jgi:hypothetical protein